MKNRSVVSIVSLVIVFTCITICVFLMRRNRTLLYSHSSLYTEAETTHSKNLAVINGCVNINIASAEELSHLPGIGTTLAIRIVQYRIDNGNYSSTKELLKVEGMDESKYNMLIEYITLGQ